MGQYHISYPACHPKWSIYASIGGGRHDCTWHHGGYYPVLRIIPPPCLMLSWRCHFRILAVLILAQGCFCSRLCSLQIRQLSGPCEGTRIFRSRRAASRSSEGFVGLFRRPFWSLWANFFKKGSKRVPFKRPFWSLWVHFLKKGPKREVRCKVGKKTIEKVKKCSFLGGVKYFSVKMCEKCVPGLPVQHDSVLRVFFMVSELQKWRLKPIKVAKP